MYFYQYLICVVKKAAALIPYWKLIKKVLSVNNIVIKFIYIFVFFIYMINIGLSAYKLLQSQLPDMDKLCLGSIL